MSGKVVGLVFEHYPGGGQGELLLAVKLADNAHDDGARIFPSVARLAESTRQDRRTVQRQLRRMQDTGWLQLVRYGTGGRGKAAEYRIDPVWMASHDARIPEADRPTWTPKEKPQAGRETVADGVESGGVQKGGIVPPFIEPERAASETQKGGIQNTKGRRYCAAPTSLTVKEPIPPNPPPGGAREFDGFIQAWPVSKRTKLLRARRLFDALVAGGAVQAADLVATAASQAELQCWAGDGAKRVPAPDRWLREQRWLDGTAGQPGQGEAQAAAWSDSRHGVEAMGERLGLGKWDQAAHGSGQGEHWPAYRARVIAAAAAPERKVA